MNITLIINKTDSDMVEVIGERIEAGRMYPWVMAVIHIDSIDDNDIRDILLATGQVEATLELHESEK